MGRRGTYRPHKFQAVFSVHLHGEELHTDFRVINTGDSAFDFTAALHSYYEVLDIAKARVLGLDGLTYLDKVTCAPFFPTLHGFSIMDKT